MKTAKEIYKEIRDMDSVERYKLTSSMLKFIDSKEIQSELLIELIEELTKVKQDLEFLSGKVGTQEMYITRLLKEKESNMP
jgi:hypothetical protein